MVSLSFTAPIAALLDLEETAVFHAFGESNAGKTLMQKVAASVLGRAGERPHQLQSDADRLAGHDGGVERDAPHHE